MSDSGSARGALLRALPSLAVLPPLQGRELKVANLELAQPRLGGLEGLPAPGKPRPDFPIKRDRILKSKWTPSYLQAPDIMGGANEKR